MPRVTITQIHEQEPPPFGPCKFEPDGKKISRDLCVVRSGNPKVNGKCEDCPSPYRMCKQCSRENRRRHVSDPPTGDGLCAECGEQKAPRQPHARYVPSGPFVTGLAFEDEMKRRPGQHRVRLSGHSLVAAIREHRDLAKETNDVQRLAETMYLPIHTVRLIARITPQWPEELLAVVKEYDLSMNATNAMNSSPTYLHRSIAEAIREHSLKVWRLEMVVYWVTELKRGTWRELLEKEGVELPEGTQTP